MLYIWVRCAWPVCSPYAIHMLCVYSVWVCVQSIRFWCDYTEYTVRPTHSGMHTHTVYSPLYMAVPIQHHSLYIHYPYILYTYNPLYAAPSVHIKYKWPFNTFYFFVHLCGMYPVHIYAEYPYMLYIWVHCTWPLCSPYTIHMLCVYCVWVCVQTIRCW